MKIAIVADTKDDYSLANKSIYYNDFSELDEIGHVKEALELAGHTPVWMGAPHHFVDYLTKERDSFDIVFNMAEGCFSRNREGLIPSLCEVFGIPYTGTDAFGLSLALHKYHTKLFFSAMGLSVAKGFLFIPAIHELSKLSSYVEANTLNYPIVVRPNHEGSSMGLSVVSNEIELQEKVSQLIDRYDQEILCDEYIDGLELSVPILGTGRGAIALGIADYRLPNGDMFQVFSTEIKKSGNHIIEQAKLPTNIEKNIIEQSLLAHNCLGCRDISRTDIRLKNDTPYFTEITPLPSLERDALFVPFANLNGYEFHEIIAQIVEAAWRRHKGK